MTNYSYLVPIMALIPRAEVSDVFPDIQQEIARLSASPEFHSASNWFRAQEPQLAHWQLEMARIPAPAEVPYPVMMEPHLIVEFYSR